LCLIRRQCIRLVVVGSGEKASDAPFMYGRTAVDLNSCIGSLLAAGLVVFVSFRTNEEGYAFETSTHDKCFFLQR